MEQVQQYRGNIGIFGILVLALMALGGVVLFLGGGWLLMLGGSPYYLIAGLLYLLAAVMLFQGRVAGTWIVALVTLATAIWAW